MRTLCVLVVLSSLSCWNGVAVGTATISIGGAKVQDLAVSVQGFTSYRAAMDNRYDGIIGYNYMRQFRVTLDFARARLILSNP